MIFLQSIAYEIGNPVYILSIGDDFASFDCTNLLWQSFALKFKWWFVDKKEMIDKYEKLFDRFD